MKSYTYYFADGTTSTILIEDKWHKILTDLDKEEKNNNRCNTRRHIPIEKLLEENKEPSVIDEHLDCELFDDITDARLKTVLSTLTEKQKKLLYDVAVLCIPQKEIAERDGMSATAINNRYIRIIKKFQTFFEGNVDF